MQTDVKSPLFDASELEDSRGPRNLREKRPMFACDEEKTALQICLEYLHKILKRYRLKNAPDVDTFFVSFVVTEVIWTVKQTRCHTNGMYHHWPAVQLWSYN